MEQPSQPGSFEIRPDSTAEVLVSVLPDAEMPDSSSKTNLARLVTRAVKLQMSLNMRGELIDETQVVVSPQYTDEAGVSMTDLMKGDDDDADDVIEWFMVKEHYDHLIGLFQTYFPIKNSEITWEETVKTLADEATTKGLRVEEEPLEDEEIEELEE